MHAPRLFHPLNGSNLSTLIAVLWRNGLVAPERLPHAGLALLSTLMRWPFYSLEKIRVARMIRAAPPMAPPIFIVGHWRSGTTHLYNILSKSPDFGYVTPLATGMPWDMLGLVALLRPLLEKSLPDHRFIDPIPVRPDSPQEDEAAMANMGPLSFYHGLYFPKRFRENFDRGVFFEGCSAEDIERWRRSFVYFLRKVSLDQKGRRLVIKNPVYTARIALLREIWPGAQFIHVTRNPYEVFQSMRNFYVKLFEELALQPFDGVDIDRAILDDYPRLMNRLLAESAGLSAREFAELRYDDLVADPLGEIERLYRALELPGFERARPAFAAYLESVAGYRTSRYRQAPEGAERVARAWAPFIERWGYGRPA